MLISYTVLVHSGLLDTIFKTTMTTIKWKKKKKNSGREVVSKWGRLQISRKKNTKPDVLSHSSESPNKATPEKRLLLFMFL